MLIAVVTYESIYDSSDEYQLPIGMPDQMDMLSDVSSANWRLVLVNRT